MGFLNELLSVRSKLRDAYIALVKKYGNNGELDTFNICSKKELSMEGKTIYKIKVIDYNIMFYYNENNSPTYHYFLYFDLEMLASLYDKLADTLAKRHNTMRPYRYLMKYPCAYMCDISTKNK